MNKETKTYTVTQITNCGATRCIHNADYCCTAETVVIGKGGDCASEKWGQK